MHLLGDDPGTTAASDDWAPAGHRVRCVHQGESSVDCGHVNPAGSSEQATFEKWRDFGKAVLAFHHRVWMTAMCRCGRTVIECDVLHHARELGLLPPLR